MRCASLQKHGSVHGTYHLAELDGAQIAVPVAGKRIKVFKKRHEDEPNLVSIGGNDVQIRDGDGSEIDE